MKELDRALGALGEATHADRFREIHSKSLSFFDKVLSADFDLCEENKAMLNLQKDCALKAVGIAARVAIELYRGSKADVVMDMYRELQAAKAGAAIEAAPVEEEMPEDWGR